MRRLLIACVLLLLSSHVSAQQRRGVPQGEFQLYYQRVQGFDFNSGSPQFLIEDESINGGGFGIVYNLNRWFGIWSQSTFFGAVEHQTTKLNLINQMQGAKLTARGVGPLNFFGKGGIGFTRHVFSFPGGEGVRYGTSFLYGGGVEIPLREGLFLILDASQLSFSLPELFLTPDRDKWDGSLLFTTGVAFHF